MGALATTISSQVSKELFVTVCLVRLICAGTVTYTQVQDLPKRPMQSSSMDLRLKSELWEACRQVREPRESRC